MRRLPHLSLEEFLAHWIDVHAVLNEPFRLIRQYVQYHTLIDDPTRIVASKDQAPHVVDRIRDRRADCWRMMDEQITPGRYVLGDELSVLDLYVAVISRFAPGRTRFYKSAPKMAEIVRQVDADPRLKEFWAKRFPFDEGWER